MNLLMPFEIERARAFLVDCNHVTLGEILTNQVIHIVTPEQGQGSTPLSLLLIESRPDKLGLEEGVCSVN